MIAAVEALAVERNKEALALRDKGQVKEAKQILLDNSSFLRDNAARYSSPRLQKYSTTNDDDATNLDSDKWQEQRKKMKKKAYELDSQQSY
jgi:Ca-activated chloride channel family protein